MPRRLVLVGVLPLLALVGCTSRFVDLAPPGGSATARRIPLPLSGPKESAAALASPAAPSSRPSLETDLQLSARLQRDPLILSPSTYGAPWSGVATENEEPLFDLPIFWNSQVREQIARFIGPERQHFAVWLARTSRYFPLMRSIVREEGLPEDLVYLALIESGLSMKAYSSKQATGPWQFIASTGKTFGLRIDWWVDERRDPEKSTRAAARYLKQLVERYDDWMLAMAAYNAGEGRVDRAIRDGNSRNYWHLAARKLLPPETRSFIPRLMAAAIIARHSKFYGFTDIEYYDKLAFDTVQVPSGTDLGQIAQTIEVELEALRLLNPALRRRLTPPQPSPYPLRIPVGKGTQLRAALAAWRPSNTVPGLLRHTVKPGESLWMIAKKYGVTTRDVIMLNELKNPKRLHPGESLLVPMAQTELALQPKPGRQATKPGIVAQEVGLTASVVEREFNGAPDGSGRGSHEARQGAPHPVVAFHTIQSGESLTQIAERYGLSVQQLRAVNADVEPRRLQVGQTLRLPNGLSDGDRAPGGEEMAPDGRRGRQSADGRATPATLQVRRAKPQPGAGERPALAKASSSAQAGTANHGAPSTSHNVLRGETLWSIARAYGVSLSALRETNPQLVTTTALRAGEQLRLPDGARSAASTSLPVAAASALQGGALPAASPQPGAEPRSLDRAVEAAWAGASGALAPLSPQIHVVQPGETLWSIARRYNVSVQHLRAANNLRDASHLRAGDRLRLSSE